MKTLLVLGGVAWAALFAVGRALAADQSAAASNAAPTSEDGGLRQWKDDFSDLASFTKNWVPYG